MISAAAPPSTFKNVVLVTGVSTAKMCGVRDHAQALAHGLADTGIEAIMEWGELSPKPSRTEIEAWLKQVVATAHREHPTVILFHYSVFTLSWRGIPLHATVVARRLRNIGPPVVTLLHEFAYPWGRRGWRGLIHAVSQRIALIAVVRSARCLVVTTPDRCDWLQERRWLPKRPVAFVPVFSSVPVQFATPKIGDAQGAPSADVAVVGYGTEGARADLVVKAVRLTTVAGLRLLLVGAPGPDSGAARVWSEAATHCGCPLHFTGLLPPEALSAALSSAGVIVFADEAGPTARKSTLAAAMAHGKAIIALDGPQTWDDLRACGAVSIVPPEVHALSAEIARLLDDSSAREALGERARDFYANRMALAHAAPQVASCLIKTIAAPDPPTVAAQLHLATVVKRTSMLVRQVLKSAGFR